MTHESESSQLVIEKALFYRSGSFNPYENLALEEYFFDTLPSHTAMLYLWQNRKTVVIGKNQNYLKECRLDKLESDGGFLARRLSGGGAVYHDDGNVNYTFLLRREDYDVQRQLDIIIACLANLGIATEKSGRNDLVIAAGEYAGCKFSGNAFHHRGDRCFHHGTLMLYVDEDKLEYYLSPSAGKLETKGIASVRSRVVNLQQLQPDLTVELIAESLEAAFFKEYKQPHANLDIPLDGFPLIQNYREKFESPVWKYGQNIPFSLTLEHRFSWGEIEIQFTLKDGIVRDVRVYSDALDSDYIESIAPLLMGIPFSRADLMAALTLIRHGATSHMTEDILDFLASQEF